MEFLRVGSRSEAVKYRAVMEPFKNEPIPSIWGVYEKPSKAKVNAYDECAIYARDYAQFLRSRGYKARLIDWGVISHNSCFFTFAAIVRMSDEENGLSETDVALIMKPSGDKFEVVL